MSGENVIHLEVKLLDFERQIEDRFKPALRAAIEQVMCEFIAEIAVGETVTKAESA